MIDRRRGYVYVRFKRRGVVRKELVGRTTDVDVFDRANARAQHLRNNRRILGSDFEPRKQRLLVEDAADLFLRLHGSKRESTKSVADFRRYVRLIKRAWTGRYVDAIVGDDMRDYRSQRRQEGVTESTVNREHTLSSRCSTSSLSGAARVISRGASCCRTANPGKGARRSMRTDLFERA